MNKTEERLSDALEALAGTVRPDTLRPLPDPVPGPAHPPLAEPLPEPGPPANPRPGRHRAWLVPLTSAAAVVLVAALSLVLAGRAGFGPPAAPPAGLPRYYVVLLDNPPNPPRGTYPGNVIEVRDTATGQLRDTLPLTLRVHGTNDNGDSTLAAAADDRTFFVSFLSAYTSSPSPGTNIYRFHITGSGHITGFAKVAHGETGVMAASPDGRKLAISGVLLNSGEPGGRPAITVVDLATGAWTTETMLQTTARGTTTFPPKGSSIVSLSWAADGRTLAYQLELPNAGTPTLQDDYSRDVTEIWTTYVGVSTNAAAWGRGHLVTRKPVSPAYVMASPVISHDGRSITAVIISSRPSAHPSPADKTQPEVVQISAATGRQLRVLYRGAGGHALNSDGSGHLLFGGMPGGVGWIDGGTLHPLPPIGEGAVTDFAW